MELCGTVYMSKDIETFTMNCVHCRETLHEWQEFVLHMQNSHKELRSFGDKNVELFVKQEVNLDDCIKEMENSIAQEQQCADEELMTDEKPILEEDLGTETVAFVDGEPFQDEDSNYLPPSDSTESEDEDEQEKSDDEDDNSEDAIRKKPSLKFTPCFYRHNERTQAFVELYKQCTCLWDPTDSEYKNVKKRADSVQNIIDGMKNKFNLLMTENNCKQVIEKIRNQYHSILKKKQKKNAKITNVTQEIFEMISFISVSIDDDPEDMKYKRKLSCSKCGKMFYNELIMQGHMFKEHQIGEWPYKCNECNRTFEYKLTLQMHEQRDHIGKTLPCKYCDRHFAVLTDLKRHILVHTGEKHFMCELCGKVYRSKATLGYHTAAIHTKIRAFKCTMCPKDFYKKRDLKDHIKAHLNIRDKICETCGKGFTNCHSLIRHRQIHSEVKKFACKLCDARFHQFVGLNSHMKRTHKVVKKSIVTTS